MTLASMVEREATHKEENASYCGVFEKQLPDGVPIQIQDHHHPAVYLGAKKKVPLI